MFIFIGGMQPKTVTVDETSRLCPNCGLMTAKLKRMDQYLSLFFIPLFRVSKGQEMLVCDACSAVSQPDEPFRTSDSGGAGPMRGQTIDVEPVRKPSPSGNTCRYCGQPVDPSFTYCPGCGKKLK